MIFINYGLFISILLKRLFFKWRHNRPPGSLSFQFLSTFLSLWIFTNNIFHCSFLVHSKERTGLFLKLLLQIKRCRGLIFWRSQVLYCCCCIVLLLSWLLLKGLNWISLWENFPLFDSEFISLRNESVCWVIDLIRFL